MRVSMERRTSERQRKTEREKGNRKEHTVGSDMLECGRNFLIERPVSLASQAVHLS